MSITHESTSKCVTSPVTSSPPPNDRRRSLRSSLSGNKETAKMPSKSAKRRPSDSSEHPPVAHEAPVLKGPSNLVSVSPPSGKRRKKDAALTAEEDAENKRLQKAKAALKVIKQEEKEAQKAATEAARRKRQHEAAAKKARKEEEAAAAKAAKQQRGKETAAKRAVKEAEAAINAEANAEKKLWKSNWEAYCKDNDAQGRMVPWGADDRPTSINQSHALQLYTLKPTELRYLEYCPEPGMYGNTVKLFDESEVKLLAFRKYAMLAGVPPSDQSAMIQRGKELWEEEGRRGPGCPIFTPNAEHEMETEQDEDAPNWWRDPRMLRRMGYQDSKLQKKSSTGEKPSADK